MHEIFDSLIRRLGMAVPDLGRDTAGDATALNARRKQGRSAEEEQKEGLPQASGGRKEYTDDEGRVTKAVEWFGFKLHLLVDVKHEVSLAYTITDTKAGDGETLPDILAEARKNLPPQRIRTLAYDKAADTNHVHKRLSKARLKVFWGADDGNLTGSRRFFALLGVVLVVHATFATLLAMAPRRQGTLGQTKLSPIAKALHGKASPPPPPRKPRRRGTERQLRLRFTG